tara:strand:- start:11496 stop:12011 length:516 start_codon:yes stop_codon:yes gene_type:complete
MSKAFHAGEKGRGAKCICRTLEDGGEIASDLGEERFESLSGLRKPGRQRPELVGALAGQAQQLATAIFRIVHAFDDAKLDEEVYALGGNLMRLPQRAGNVGGRGRLVLADEENSRDSPRRECDPGCIQHVVSLGDDQFCQSLKLVGDEGGPQPVCIDEIFVAHLPRTLLYN